jgi:[lysine-biosynthesis-protein LysW]--L-2-aminoadipate ligase
LLLLAPQRRALLHNLLVDPGEGIRQGRRPRHDDERFGELLAAGLSNPTLDLSLPRHERFAGEVVTRLPCLVESMPRRNGDQIEIAQGIWLATRERPDDDESVNGIDVGGAFDDLVKNDPLSQRWHALSVTLVPALHLPLGHHSFTASTPHRGRRGRSIHCMRIGIVTCHPTETNLRLAVAAPQGARGFVVAPEEAVRELQLHDAALGRLDVLPTLDGIEPGLSELERLEQRGVPVLNAPLALRLAHDKLATAPALAAAALPHPRTRALVDPHAPPPMRFPFVVKPRFGSWGRDVLLCADEAAYSRALARLRKRAWFASTGGIAQELVPPLGHDVRVIVAAGDVIGAIKRVARPGEWRTNVALGASRVPTDPSPAACELALAAAAAIGADLVGVDLLPVGPGRYAVLELNGAVDFAREYDPRGDVFGSAMRALTSRLRSDAVLPLEPIEAFGA